MKRPALRGYGYLLHGIVQLLTDGRRLSGRAVNFVMTATYWEVGRRIVEHEQQGRRRAEYGQKLLVRLSADLQTRFGRGFGVVNLSQMRKFYLLWPIEQILQTMPEPLKKMVTCKGIFQTLSEKSGEIRTSHFFRLPWSHYVSLMSVEKVQARRFYESEDLRCGWSGRQLDRQITSLFYERTLLSRNKAKMLQQSHVKRAEEEQTPEEEIREPLVLEFLGLKDEYSESALEEALIKHLEHFLLELGNDFTFVSRQKRLRVGDDWYRIDLLFFHRRLRCLIIVDLKIGKFTHADARQMNLYVNYARQHWTHPYENPPVGLILCAKGNEAVAHYALGNLPNKVLAREYRLSLPDEKQLIRELERTTRLLGKGNPQK